MVMCYLPVFSECCQVGSSAQNNKFKLFQNPFTYLQKSKNHCLENFITNFLTYKTSVYHVKWREKYIPEKRNAGSTTARFYSLRFVLSGYIFLSILRDKHLFYMSKNS